MLVFSLAERGGLLDAAVWLLEGRRADRHGVHCAAQAAAHLPPLVPPHHRARLHLACLQGPHCRRQVTNKLLSTFYFNGNRANFYYS